MIKRENDSMNETRNFHVTNVPLFSQQAVKKIVMDNKQIIKKNKLVIDQLDYVS